MLSTTRTSRGKLSLEALEDRTALSVTVFNGNLWIGGTNGNDDVAVNWSRSGNVTVTDNGTSYTFQLSAVIGGCFFFGYDGNDYFENNTWLSTWAYGGGGNDWIHGGSYNDYLDGGSGGDILWGESGEDNLTGGSGNDVLLGGVDADRLWGGDGDDWLSGGVDGVADYLNGGAGRDLFEAELFNMHGTTRNRDTPSDFNPAEDQWWR